LKKHFRALEKIADERAAISGATLQRIARPFVGAAA
jgi:hypothetical protein